MIKASLASTLVVLLGLLAPGAAHAQRGRDGGAQKPPAGMCRIWVEGVPAGQQPAPTDCATALRTRPSNGRVIFGDEAETPKKGRGSLLPKDWQTGRQEPRRTEPRRDEPRREEPRREEPRREEPRREPQPERKAEPRREEPRPRWDRRPQQDPK